MTRITLSNIDGSQRIGLVQAEEQQGVAVSQTSGVQPLSVTQTSEAQGVKLAQVGGEQPLSLEQADEPQELRVSPEVKFLRGFSPTIEVEEVEGGFNVTVTDAEHVETVFIASGGEVSEEQVAEAVAAYFEENPLQSGATEEQAEQIERNRLDIVALAKAVGDIEIPEVDLSGYARKSELPSVEGLASESFVREYAQPVGSYLTERPTYTADEVGADAKGSASAALESAKAYADKQIASIPTPDVSGQIGTHNTATDAHNDIRLFMQDLMARVNALADSDDETLDQMSEIVAYIKDNRDLIEKVTTGKVSVSDIVDNVTTNVSNRPLSAAQGVALKALIDAITVPAKVSELANDAGYLTEHQSLVDYALKTEMPTKVGQLENDAGYLTNDVVGAFYKADWICSEASGIDQRYTDSITLPAGTYIVSVVAPYCSDMAGRVCIGFSAGMAIGVGNTFIDSAYGAVAMLARFTSTANLYVKSAASSNSAKWSYLERGGLAAVRIA